MLFRSTFRVFLPRVPVAAGAETAALEPMPSGTETILLVEDEEGVLTLVRKTLEQQGYTVLAATTSSAALAACRGTPGPIHLLLTDVVMPEMGGCELAEQIRAVRPGIRVLFMSGYAADARTHRVPVPAGAPLVQKPFPRSTIARRVRDVLDAPPGPDAGP